MRKSILSLCAVVLLSSCKEETTNMAEFDYGTIEKGVYHNSFFDFDLAFNENWSLQTKEEISDISKLGQELMAGENQKLQKTLEASKVNVADLFTIFKYPITSIQESNASMSINAENLKQFPEVKTTADYIAAVRSLLDETTLVLVYVQTPSKKTIGGQEFMVMEIYNQDYNITQEYWATLRKGFAISMVISYKTEDQKDELYKMIDSIKFK